MYKRILFNARANNNLILNVASSIRRCRKDFGRCRNGRTGLQHRNRNRLFGNHCEGHSFPAIFCVIPAGKRGKCEKSAAFHGASTGRKLFSAKLKKKKGGKSGIRGFTAAVPLSIIYSSRHNFTFALELLKRFPACLAKRPKRNGGLSVPNGGNFSRAFPRSGSEWTSGTAINHN